MDLSSKKVPILIGLMLLVFFLLVLSALNQLSEYEQNQYVQNEIPIENVEKEAAQQEFPNDNEENTGIQKTLNINLNKDTDIIEDFQAETVQKNNELTEISPITPSAAEKLSPEQEIELKFYAVEKYKQEKLYTKAIEEYEKIAAESNDNNIKARCYEKIADVYGISKRYGSALAYAQKAYNYAPTSYREMQIARLYYKTGDIDKATKRINNILQRDFASEN